MHSIIYSKLKKFYFYFKFLKNINNLKIFSIYYFLFYVLKKNINNLKNF